MAGRSQRQLKQSYRLFAAAGGEADTAAAAAAAGGVSGEGMEELDELEESQVWGSAIAEEDGEAAPAGPRGAPRKQLAWGGADHRRRAAVPASLPVNIPDWSKILREEAAAAQRRFGEDSWDGEEVVPPHEYLWKKRAGAASFSVHEGVGRTLKGRDLSRVRNDVWRQIGFVD
ncbi:protein S40-4-like [Wolffia australiana]